MIGEWTTRFLGMAGADTWADYFAIHGWVLWMGFVTALTCGLIGCFLNLRRGALLGDALSHAVLPGLVVGFFFSRSLLGLPVVIGAVGAAMLCTALIHAVHSHSTVKEETATGIAFTTLFALGVVAISLFASKVHLDAECVLYGEITMIPFETRHAYLPGLGAAARTLGLGETVAGALEGIGTAPESVVVMSVVALLVIVVGALFYKELVVASFDAGLASSLGVSPTAVHYALTLVTALAVVAAFNAVGAILVVAMLVIPGSTAFLLAERLPRMLALVAVQAALISLGGVNLGIALACSTAGAMVVVAFALFLAAWVLSPRAGLAARWWRRRRLAAELAAAPPIAAPMHPVDPEAPAGS